MPKEFRCTVIIDLNADEPVDDALLHDSFRDYLEDTLISFSIFDEDDADVEISVKVETIREIDVEVLQG